MFKPDAVAICPTTMNQAEFFKYWLLFLKPYHSFSNKQLEIAAAFLQERHNLSKKIADEVLVDKMLLSKEYKDIIKNKFNLNTGNFQMILGRLRSNKFIVGKRINPRFIPRLKKESGQNAFTLLISFNIDGQNTETSSKETQPEEKVGK